MFPYNYGYVTLLSTVDYLPAVLVLHESLKRVNSNYPLIVGVTDDIYSQVEAPLRANGCLLEKINKLTYHQEVINRWNNTELQSVLNTASKISLFDLKSWDKLVYIDADCIILQNVDELFNWPDGSMIRYAYDERGFGFTGLMVFCPKNHDTELYMSLITNVACADGDLLGRLWFQAKSNPTFQIPESYLTAYCSERIKRTAFDNNWREYKILHFINKPKPWQDNYQYDDSWYLHYYKTLLDDVRKLYSPLA